MREKKIIMNFRNYLKYLKGLLCHHYLRQFCPYLYIYSLRVPDYIINYFN